MQVRDIMTENPVCCSPRSTIQEAAKLMAEHDCGELPVVDDQNRPVGVVTDRDICCRAVAKGKEVANTTVGEVMSQPAVTVKPDDSLHDCCDRMEENQIRRVPVVDDYGSCCGIVAQADIARGSGKGLTADLVKDISQPTEEASRGGCC